MDRQVLADRIVTYSDTVVAFALVNGFAFVITLGEPDIRCSIADVSWVAYALNLFFPIVGTGAVVWLRRYEHRLRYETANSEEAARASSKAGTEDALVSRFWRIAFVVRLVLIWLFSLIVIVGIYGATRDDRCLAVLG